MVVVAVLRNGAAFPFTHARAALTWIVLFSEDDAMRFVPYTEVVGVTVGRRPGSPPEKTPVGFSVDRVDDEVVKP
mgnify:CR=1 FL=1